MYIYYTKEFYFIKLYYIIIIIDLIFIHDSFRFSISKKFKKFYPIIFPKLAKADYLIQIKINDLQYFVNLLC